MFSQNTPWFSCQETGLSSFLKSGYFQKFIYSELKMTGETTVKLFGKLYPADCCLWTNMQKLFMKISSNFAIVESVAGENTNSFSSKLSFPTVENLRMDIVEVLHIYLINLQELCSKNDSYSFQLQHSSLESSHLKRLLVPLIKEIKNLLLCVNTPGIFNFKKVDSDISELPLDFYHYYHLCLDIRYNCIAMVYAMHFLLPTNFGEVVCDYFDQSAPFLQLTSLIIFELSLLAMKRYKNTHLCDSIPFSCPCIREFWIMLIILLDKFSFYFEGPSFWSVYLQVMGKSMSTGLASEDSSFDSLCITSAHFQIQDLTEAWFWLTSHVAPLYKYNSLGYFNEHETAKSGYAVIKFLVNNLISKSPGEKYLRNALSYCIPLVKLWEPSGDILLPLTDFYIKKIEEKFSIQGIELLYLFKDSLTWFTYIQNVSNFISYGKESSFDLFLYILNLQLKLDSGNSIWRSLKGRIYSKFIPKRIKELSDVGLQNIFSLLLIIVMSGQLEVINKICEMASFIEQTANPNRQIISWKAIFVLMYICQDKKHNVSKITTDISNFFDSASSHYSLLHKDSIHKTKVMDLLSVYIVNMNELFKRNSNLNLSECQLINAGFSKLLSAGGMTDILGIILTILQRIQRITESSTIDSITNETGCIKTLQLVFSYIYPFVENLATMDAAPLVVSDIAATLTKLAYDFSSAVNCISYSFHSIFKSFVCKENVSSIITCQYLCFIFKFPHLMMELSLKVANLDILIIQSWLKCIIYTQIEMVWMKDLTQKVLQLATVVEILPDVKNLNLHTDDHVCIAINFFQFLGDTFNKSCLQEKTKIAQRVQRFFKNYASLILSKIKKDKEGPALSHVYKLTSHLFEFCSSVLHFKVTSEYILLQILDQTLYPQLIFPRDKALQSLVSCSIKEYLPRFMRGLSKLDYEKDISIGREIRDIFIYYLGVFPASSNPLTKLIIDSFSQKPGGLTTDACKFIFEVLKTRLLSGNSEKPISIFEFYQEVLRLSPLAYKEEIVNILLRCAMEIYMKQNKLADFLKVLIRKTLVYFKEKIPLVDAKKFLVPVIKWFVREKLQWAVARGYSVLDIFVEHFPQVLLEVVPFLTKSVETLERNRGLGEDLLLRNGLRDLIYKLQKKFVQS